MATSTRFKALDVCVVLLRVLLESTMEIIDGGQVETRTSQYYCVGVGSKVKQILLGCSSFTTPTATMIFLTQLESVELA